MKHINVEIYYLTYHIAFGKLRKTMIFQIKVLCFLNLVMKLIQNNYLVILLKNEYLKVSKNLLMIFV